MLHPRGVYRVLLICRIILLLLRIQGVGGWGQLVTTQDAVGASASKSFCMGHAEELTYSLNPRIRRIAE